MGKFPTARVIKDIFPTKCYAIANLHMVCGGLRQSTGTGLSHGCLIFFLFEKSHRI